MSAGCSPGEPVTVIQQSIKNLSEACTEQELPALVIDDDDAPVFAEPWQAQVFALTVQLHANELFEWKEWASVLSSKIKVAQSRGDPDLGDTYYHHWLAALEQLLLDKKVTTGEQLQDIQQRWEHAASTTPHGQPIVIDESL